VRQFFNMEAEYCKEHVWNEKSFFPLLQNFNRTVGGSWKLKSDGKLL
jgi:hypothetical protein